MIYSELFNSKKVILEILENFVNGYKGEDTKAIKALSNKIEHMCFNIGCPSAVEPMLRSIINRKLKRWYTIPLYLYKNSSSMVTTVITKIDKRKKTHLAEKYFLDKGGDSFDRPIVMEGHFRWDFDCYILTRDATDYISKFFFNCTYI
jgi:hypothetical protein